MILLTCGACCDMWPHTTERCLTCGSKLTPTTGDRVNAKFYGGLRAWEAPSGRVKEPA